MSDDPAARIVELAAKARSYGGLDPEVALGQARKAAEAICRAIFEREIGEPGKIMLDAMLQKLAAAKHIPPSILVPFGTIQAYGNFGTHAQSDSRALDASYVAPALAALSQVVTWFFVDYLKTPVPVELDEPLLAKRGMPAVVHAQRRRRWPWIAGAVALVAGGAVAAIVVTRGRTTAVPFTASYRVMARTTDAPHLVAMNESLFDGAHVFFEFQLSQPAHVVVCERIEGSGKLLRLFPQPGIAVHNPVPAGEWVRIPSGTVSFVLDDNDRGTDALYIVASRRPLSALEKALDRLDANAPGAQAQVEDLLAELAWEKHPECAAHDHPLAPRADGSGCAIRVRGAENGEGGTPPARAVTADAGDDTIFVPFYFQHVRAR